MYVVVVCASFSVRLLVNSSIIFDFLGWVNCGFVMCEWLGFLVVGVRGLFSI